MVPKKHFRENEASGRILFMKDEKKSAAGELYGKKSVSLKVYLCQNG